MQKREQDIKKRELLLAQKEQQLLIKEKDLQLKEEELAKREISLDSTLKKDTSELVDSSLVGNWLVQMTCTETSCAGSAVGDTKSEQWQINYENKTLIARALVNNKLVRLYTGFFTGNTAELVEQSDTANTQSTAKMIVRLRIVDDAHLEGQREIIRKDCKIIYDLDLEKQKG